ncbi:hypothetical protein [Amphritea opalescens]|uniref:hypothetical protein n=1 Tax=Amphritea opalescens TaxID=2490544 RepID=UPI0019D2CF8E|nr:hypothetical protein [Amphritea opalescens]
MRREGLGHSVALISAYYGSSQCHAKFCYHAATVSRCVILGLGLDASEQDPFAVLKLTTEGFADIGKRIKALNKPTVIIQEGGYISPILGNNLAAVLKPFCQS